MNNFFLINETIELDDTEAFIIGMLTLNSIEKQDDHIFKKNNNLYNLSCYETLFSDYSQEKQVIVKFLEQLSTIENVIDTEELANNYTGTEENGFLGIDFSRSQIVDVIKHIRCKGTYSIWLDNYASNFTKLNAIVDNFNFSANFKRDFSKLDDEVQISIIQEFLKAKNRGLVTPFYPDTKIVKDVSLANAKCKVMELRVYRPLAIRVYFNENNGFVNVVSVEQKSNPNQNTDISKAQDYLLNM